MSNLATPSKDFLMQFNPAVAITSWEKRLSEVITPMQIQLLQPDNSFNAWWQHIDLDAISINIHHSPAQQVRHDLEQSQDKYKNSYDLHYITRGSISVVHDGNKFHVPEGHLVLLNLERPFVLDMDCPNESIGLHVDASWLQQWLPDPDVWVAQAIDATKGWAAPLGTLLRTITNEGLGNLSISRDSLSNHIGASISLLMAENKNHSFMKPQRGLFQRLYKEIKANYHDPAFTQAYAAEQLGVSKRHLQAVCARVGTTFSNLLMEVRLKKSREMLGDWRFQFHNIGEIAFMCGFLDQSHFARRFRIAFGISPSAYREECPDPVGHYPKLHNHH